jgi:RNA polymerase sigma-70 factor (ECF subfamily)
MSARADFLHLFDRCERDLRAYIGAVIRDLHAREDVFQEVSVVLWKSFEDYDPARSFGAWARGIATNKMLEARRRNARFPLLFPQETLEAILEAFEAEEPPAAEEEVALAACLRELPERSREILRWRYEAGQPCARIARQLGSTLKAVHQTLCRLRQALARCIEKRLAAGRTAEADAEEPVFTLTKDCHE